MGDKGGKSNLGIVLLAILGFLGVGTIGSMLIKGMKATKVVRSATTFNRALKSERSVPSVNDYAKDSHSAVDKANTMSGINERKKEDKKRRNQYK